MRSFIEKLKSWKQKNVRFVFPNIGSSDVHGVSEYEELSTSTRLPKSLRFIKVYKLRADKYLKLAKPLLTSYTSDNDFLP
jgi:hypothetical protein